MLPRILNTNKVKKAWFDYVDGLNDAQPLVEHKRTMPDGSVKVYLAKKKVVSDRMRDTGERVVIQYIKAYETAFKLGFESKQGEVPTLFTNGPKFGKNFKISGRAMRTRIAKLLKLEFIDKIWHGTRHDYEIWIMPKFLFTEAQMAEIEERKNAQKSAQNSSKSLSNGSDLPHNVAFETLETKEKEITQVDKYGVAAQQHVLPVGEDTATQLETQKTCYTRPQLAAKTPESRPKRSVAAKSATRQDTRAGGAAAAAEATKKAVFIAYVEHFWQVAWALIYPKADFNPYMIRKAKIAIWNGVYEKFQANLTDDEWQLYHTQAIERLQLAAQYYEKHPDKYAPMPYHEWVAGTGYFDSDNKRGFAGTHAWYTRTQVWKKEEAVKAALSRSQREFSLHKSGKTHKLDKRLRDKSLLQLFKFHEDKIRRLGRPALDKFYAMHAIKV